MADAPRPTRNTFETLWDCPWFVTVGFDKDGKPVKFCITDPEDEWGPRCATGLMEDAGLTCVTRRGVAPNFYSVGDLGAWVKEDPFVFTPVKKWPPAR